MDMIDLGSEEGAPGHLILEEAHVAQRRDDEGEYRACQGADEGDKEPETWHEHRYQPDCYHNSHPDAAIHPPALGGRHPGPEPPLQPPAIAFASASMVNVCVSLCYIANHQGAGLKYEFGRQSLNSRPAHFE